MTIAIKNLILWRHAEAEHVDIALSVEDDMARKLTPKGERQARLMARWLHKHLPKNLMLISSPAVRAFQTAEALNYNINLHPDLKPGADLNEILIVLENIETSKQNLLIVGHQPWLGALVAHLTGYSDRDINIKKGAIWWLRQSTIQPGQYNIFTVQTPSLLPS